MIIKDIRKLVYNMKLSRNIEKAEVDYFPSPMAGYRLPLASGEPKISQGYNGNFSHFALRKCGYLYDLRFAVDFAQDYGAEVIASRDGIVEGVIDSFDDFYEGLDMTLGIRTWHNFIILRHDDQSFTLYSHLEKGSSEVDFEDKVNAGQAIARTGKSGWVGPVPHLHFEAYRTGSRRGRFTFPVAFDDYSGSLEDVLTC